MLKTYHASCHCGDVRFDCELDLSQGTSRCNCSISLEVALWKAIVKACSFRLLQGDQALADYRFGSHSIRHRFCRRCGVKAFGQGHLDALGGVFYAVNVMCLDASDAELAQAPIVYEDGRNDNWQSPPAESRYL